MVSSRVGRRVAESRCASGRDRACRSRRVDWRGMLRRRRGLRDSGTSPAVRTPVPRGARSLRRARRRRRRHDNQRDAMPSGAPRSGGQPRVLVGERPRQRRVDRGWGGASDADRAAPPRREQHFALDPGRGDARLRGGRNQPRKERLRLVGHRRRWRLRPRASARIRTAGSDRWRRWWREFRVRRRRGPRSLVRCVDHLLSFDDAAGEAAKQGSERVLGGSVRGCGGAIEADGISARRHRRGGATAFRCHRSVGRVAPGRGSSRPGARMTFATGCQTGPARSMRPALRHSPPTRPGTPDRVSRLRGEGRRRDLSRRDPGGSSGSPVESREPRAIAAGGR